jgi:hypothetical protein
MAIIQTIDNSSQFRDAFHHANRANQFSYEALGIVFDYLNDCGSDVEMDVVAICCEFAEDTPKSIAESFDVDIADLEEDEAKQHVMNFLCDNTSVVGETSSGAFVYVQF